MNVKKDMLGHPDDERGLQKSFSVWNLNDMFRVFQNIAFSNISINQCEKFQSVWAALEIGATETLQRI